MKKFGKRKMALMLACASFLTHGPKSSALTKNQKITAGIVGALGGGAVLTTAYYLIFGKNNKNIVKNMTKEELQNKQNKISYEYGNKNDNNYIEENIKQTNIVHEPIVEQKNQIKSAGIQNNSAELANLINELQSANAKYRYELGEKGKVFVSNPVLEQNIVDIKEDELKNYMKELCEKTGHLHGLPTGDEYAGWERAAYEYFFVDSPNQNCYRRMYTLIGDDSRKIVAKCIKIMYENINDDQWKETISNCMLQFSMHAGHCPWRAEAIIGDVYDTLVNFLRGSGKLKQSDNITEEIFCLFKEKIVTNAKLDYLKFMELYYSHVDYLGLVNSAVSGLRYILGLPGGNSENVDLAIKQLIVSNDKRFKRVMDAENLVKISHEIIYRLNEQKCATLTKEINQLEISFREYCEYMMKSNDSRNKILNKIWNYQGAEGPKFKEWIKGNRNLKLGEIVDYLPYIFGYNDAEMSELKSPYGLEFLISCVKNGYLRLANDN